MLDFEAEDVPEIALAVKKDLVKDRPEVISALLTPRPVAVLATLCAALTWLTLTTG